MVGLVKKVRRTEFWNEQGRAIFQLVRGESCDDDVCLSRKTGATVT